MQREGWEAGLVQIHDSSSSLSLVGEHHRHSAESAHSGMFTGICALGTGRGAFLWVTSWLAPLLVQVSPGDTQTEVLGHIAGCRDRWRGELSHTHLGHRSICGGTPAGRPFCCVTEGKLRLSEALTCPWLSGLGAKGLMCVGSWAVAICAETLMPGSQAPTLGFHAVL